MASAIFDRNAWQATCQRVMDHCLEQAFTPMHRLFLFSQSIDEALMGIDRDNQDQAIVIAQGFGYESWQERSEYVDWYTSHAEGQTAQQKRPFSA